ncbi:MAG: YceH family protein [Thermoanaerobaculia bacterium]
MSEPILLDPVEIRILGSLMEKQQTTPEYYPLTLNALTTACNQKTNREPVMELREEEIERALRRLQDDGYVWQVLGGRATRWDHKLGGKWGLDPARRAVMTLLLLRGAQTPGELRGRSERMFRFETIDEVEATLRTLADREEPLARELPRRPGQKESRWMHLAGDPSALEESTADVASVEVETRSESLGSRVERLEVTVERLAKELGELNAKLGE